MWNKWQVGALAAIAAIAAFVDIYFEPPKSPLDYLRLVSASTTAATLAVTIFHFGLWRYLPRAIAPQPDINGTWKVGGIPWLLDDDGGKPVPPFEGFMFVKQDYFSLSMRQETDDSSSELEVERFVLTKGGKFVLWAIYYCEPRPSTRPGTLRPHYGAMELTFSQHELKGHFWTDGVYISRDGRRIIGGYLRLYDRKPELLQDYDVAATAYKPNTAVATSPVSQVSPPGVAAS
jgi:SMODS-associating 2TM, beta-strand rich effector domain